LGLEIDDVRNKRLQDESLGQVVGEDVNMKLVVKKFTLLCGSPLVLELPSASSVSDGALSSSLKHIDGAVGDSNSRLDHDLVNHSRIADHLKFPLAINLGESGKHC